jgi:hypothetical protein
MRGVLISSHGYRRKNWIRDGLSTREAHHGVLCVQRKQLETGCGSMHADGFGMHDVINSGTHVMISRLKSRYTRAPFEPHIIPRCQDIVAANTASTMQHTVKDASTPARKAAANNCWGILQ